MSQTTRTKIPGGVKRFVELASYDNEDGEPSYHEDEATARNEARTDIANGATKVVIARVVAVYEPSTEPTITELPL